MRGQRPTQSNGQRRGGVRRHAPRAARLGGQRPQVASDLGYGSWPPTTHAGTDAGSFSLRARASLEPHDGPVPRVRRQSRSRSRRVRIRNSARAGALLTIARRRARAPRRSRARAQGARGTRRPMHAPRGRSSRRRSPLHVEGVRGFPGLLARSLARIAAEYAPFEPTTRRVAPFACSSMPRARSSSRSSAIIARLPPRVARGRMGRIGDTCRIQSVP